MSRRRLFAAGWVGLLLAGTVVLLLRRAPVAEGPGAGTAGGEVAIRATRHFREIVLPETTVPCDGSSVIDLLRLRTEVATAPGQGFVEAIGGAGSGRGEDWFYYVNGVLAPVGAASYRPVDGDRIWWDLHPWSGNRRVSAVIGDYPEPFLGRGDAGTTRIYHGAGLGKSAQKVKAYLRSAGVGSVESELLDPDREWVGSGEHSLVLATSDELSLHSRLASLRDDPEGSGLYFRVAENGSIELLTAGGAVARTLAHGAIVSATGGRGAGTLWLVTGTDDESVRLASELLCVDNGVSGHASLAVADGELIPLPHAP